MNKIEEALPLFPMETSASIVIEDKIITSTFIQIEINFLTAYIEAYKESNIKDNYLNLTNRLNIEQMIVEANYFAFVSHLFWANWAVCQAAVCKIKFEYFVSLT